MTNPKKLAKNDPLKQQLSESDSSEETFEEPVKNKKVFDDDDDDFDMPLDDLDTFDDFSEDDDDNY